MDFEFVEPSSNDPLMEVPIEAQKIAMKTESNAEPSINKMICLLCYEPNEESMALDSEEGKRLNVPHLLFKYFRFCFAVRFQSFIT